MVVSTVGMLIKTLSSFPENMEVTVPSHIGDVPLRVLKMSDSKGNYLAVTEEKVPDNYPDHISVRYGTPST